MSDDTVVKDCVGVEINEGDFVAYVTASDRHPVFEFGWVLGFHESKSRYGVGGGTQKIKIQRADADGTRHTTTAVDVPGHWIEGTPEHIRNHRYADGRWYSATHEDYENYYVHTTHRDTGKPSTTMLEIYRGDDRKNGRLLVTKPV